ncbi:hypothetical protein GH714_033323 [Hevea brasiliensis]|uniref:DYW domain-containing protein n=1 Tax=Hevea brasiliensis TaxID=3981 RepID=A0A6A6M2L9_HEVBR|nr:hypothetical protein GH714_033323 [Hevea brasiliensis]
MAFVLKACSAIMALEEGQQVHARILRSGFTLNPYVQSSLANAGVGIEPDEVSLVGVISACAMAGALDIGKWIHAYINKRKIDIDLELNTALVNMYAKCGCIEKAKEIFDEMPVKDSKAWSSMIVGLAIHGLAEDALEVFSRMEEAKAKPNHVTFIGILSACARGGLVSEGKRHWSRMLELGIEPSMEHYGCMVDLLCRGGLVDEAYNFALSTPSPNPWEKMSHVRKKMKEKGIKAVPGCTSIEIDGFLHEFVMGDWSHPEAEEIKRTLKDVSVRIHSTGYEPCVSSVLHNVDDEEKENSVSEHSERLAIAYGLLKTKAPAAIRIVKNLTVCWDCHEVTKIISKVYNREIIVRDRVRFHKFVNGTCSCRDYW